MNAKPPVVSGVSPVFAIQPRHKRLFVAMVAQCRASASPLHCRIRDALEPELRVERLTWQGHSYGGSMPRPMMFFVSVILFMPLATVLVTAQTSLAEPAADECKTKPGSSAPPGRHWYYLINRTDQRRCWFLGPEGAYVRSQARETASKVSSSTRTR